MGNDNDSSNNANNKKTNHAEGPPSTSKEHPETLSSFFLMHRIPSRCSWKGISATSKIRFREFSYEDQILSWIKTVFFSLADKRTVLIHDKI